MYRTTRIDPKLKKVKILSISGVAYDQVEHGIANEGADGFLSKEADVETVLEKIEMLLQKT